MKTGFIFLKLWLIALVCSLADSIGDDGLSLLVADNNNYRLLHLAVSDEGVEEDVVLETSGRICGLAIDPVEEHFYWGDWSYDSIWRTDITDRNTKEIISNLYWRYSICGISLDKEARMLFYGGPGSSQISVLDLVTSQSGVLKEVPDGGDVLEITLDEENKMIYWSTRFIGIHTMDYSGNNYRQVVADSDLVLALSLDTEDGVLYFYHDYKINSIKTDGTERRVVTAESGFCSDIIYVNQTLIFLKGTNSIYSVPSTGGSVTVLASLPWRYLRRMDIISAGVNECKEGTHNCTGNSRCINTYSSFRCQCLSGYTLQGENCTDIDECVDNTDNCHEQAECSNTEGSFTCKCTGIYSGDGVTCIVPFYDKHPEIIVDLLPTIGTSTPQLIFYCNFTKHHDDVRTELHGQWMIK